MTRGFPSPHPTMKINYSLKLLAGDLTGGVITSLTALPASIAFGCYVFAPLGPAYVHAGVVTGLLSLAFINIGSSPLNGNGIMNSGPFSLTSIMMASSLVFILGRVPGTGSEAESTAMAFLFLLVLMVGLLQVLTGILRLGELIKFIPYPVLAGLFNGTALIFIFGEIGPLLGLGPVRSLGELAQKFSGTQPLTLAVGAVTFIAMWKGNMLVKKVPAPILGIVTGTLLYYFFIYLGLKGSLGPIIGTIPASVPAPRFAEEFVRLFTSPRAAEHLSLAASLLPMALGISVILSLRTLLTMVAADAVTRGRSSASRELLGQGLGNILAAIFGGIAGSGNISRTMGNHLYGARTSVSRIVCGACALLTLVFLHPLVALLPRVVIAGILIYLGFIILDRWSLALVRRVLFAGGYRSREILMNLAIVVTVVVVMIVLGIFEAVGIGIVLALTVFALRMGRNIIRRRYDASRIISNVERPLGEVKFLEREGRRIHIMELEGPLFFGTADSVAKVLNGLLSTDTEFIIIDLRKVNDIDSTGMNILVELGSRCADSQKNLLLSGITRMKNLPGSEALLAYSHDTLEDALGFAEDELIGRYYEGPAPGNEIALGEIDALAGLSAKERTQFLRYLERVEYRAGERIFGMGDPGDRMYFIISGRARIELNPASSARRQRVSTLDTGTVFGEMAILEGQPRMADAVAERDLVCLVLTTKSLDRMGKRHPALAGEVIKGIARDLSKRLRLANRILSELKK